MSHRFGRPGRFGTRIACVAGALAVPALVAGPTAADEPTPGEVTVSVQIPESGALGLVVDGASLDLGTATLGDDRSSWVADGELPTITVTDSRVTDPGWELSAQMSPLVPEGAPDGATTGALDGALFTLTPSAPDADTGEATGPEVALADAFDLGADPTTGLLASTPAGAGLGTAVVGGLLGLSAPLESDPGRYTAVLTLTVS